MKDLRLEYKYCIDKIIKLFIEKRKVSNKRYFIYMDVNLETAYSRHLFTKLLNDKNLYIFFLDIKLKKRKKIYNFTDILIIDFAKLIENYYNSCLIPKKYKPSLKYELIFFLKKLYVRFYILRFIFHFFRGYKKKFLQLDLLIFIHHKKYVYYLNQFFRKKFSQKYSFFVYDFFFQKKNNLLNVPINSYLPKFKFNEDCERDLLILKYHCKFWQNLLSEKKPKIVFQVEGDTPLNEIIAQCANKYNIKSVCFQWGVYLDKIVIPFKNFSHNYFISWGNFFINQLKNISFYGS